MNVNVHSLQNGGSALVILNNYGGVALLVDVQNNNSSSTIKIYRSQLVIGSFVSDARECA